jgi:hypothetical protein
MPVCVNEARHENPAAAIDHLRTIRWRRIARDDGFDPVAFDQQTQPFAQRARPSVEQAKIREQDRSRRRGWNWLRCCGSGHSERRK